MHRFVLAGMGARYVRSDSLIRWFEDPGNKYCHFTPESHIYWTSAALCVNLPDLPHFFKSSGVEVLRREQRQAFVGSAAIGWEELRAPLPGVVIAAEAARITRPVLDGLELALAERVVVADSRPRVAALNTQVGE